MARVQIIFMIILPIGTMIGQIIWLIIETGVHFDSIYYKWVICDVFMNAIGSTTYLIQLERIVFE